MRWIGYTTQHIHHLLNVFPKFFNVNEHDQFEMINEWESLYLKEAFYSINRDFLRLYSNPTF